MNTKNHKKYLSTFSLYGCKKSQCVHQLASSKALSHKNFVEMNTDTKKWLMCLLLTIYMQTQSCMRALCIVPISQNIGLIVFFEMHMQDTLLNPIFLISLGSLLN